MGTVEVYVSCALGKYRVGIYYVTTILRKFCLVPTLHTYGRKYLYDSNQARGSGNLPLPVDFEMRILYLPSSAEIFERLG